MLAVKSAVKHEIFIERKGVWCPCCGSKLRTGSRNMKFKIKMRVINREVMQPFPISESHVGIKATDENLRFLQLIAAS